MGNNGKQPDPIARWVGHTIVGAGVLYVSYKALKLGGAVHSARALGVAAHEALDHARLAGGERAGPEKPPTSYERRVSWYSQQIRVLQNRRLKTRSWWAG